MPKRNTKRKSKRASFKFGVSKPGRKRKAARENLNIKGILPALVLVCLLVGVGTGFVLLKKYVEQNVPVSKKTGILELVDVPGWVTKQLEQQIYGAAVAGGEDLKLDEDAAMSVQRNIAKYVAWLDEVKVKTTHNSIRISGRWRKPLAVVKLGLRRCYVDAELVVLDFVPMPNLPVVKVEGLSVVTQLPPAGELWQRGDLAAAVSILDKLDQMDSRVTPDKPLLYEIERIDVSNYKGREDPRLAHIILYAKDNTKIIWGAQIGSWQRHLEATDQQKLASLYSHYKEYGSLLNNVKYINLRDPQSSIPQPIDKY